MRPTGKSPSRSWSPGRANPILGNLEFEFLLLSVPIPPNRKHITATHAPRLFPTNKLLRKCSASPISPSSLPHLMASLDDLATEIVQEVASHLAVADQGALRATNKYLQLCVEPLLCKIIFIPSDQLFSDNTMLFIRTLANGKSCWSRYGRTLSIRHQTTMGPGSRRGSEPEDATPGLLTSALLSCARRIRTVRHFVSRDDPPWLYDVICSVLPAFPHLENFDLRQLDHPQITLPILSHLSTLRISTSPSLPEPQQFLTFGLHWRLLVVHPPATPSNSLPNPASIENVVANCPDLRVLELLGVQDWQDVWRTTLRIGIHLQSLTVDRITPSVLEYLKSYSGLQVLVIQRNVHDRRSPAELDPLAREFFDEVLPLHKSTLTVLCCPMQYENEWSISLSNIQALDCLKNLERLEMSVNQAAIERRLPCLSAFFDTIIGLPHIKHIVLSLALAEAERARVSAISTGILPNNERQIKEALSPYLGVFSDRVVAQVNELDEAKFVLSDQNTDLREYPFRGFRGPTVSGGGSVWAAVVSRRGELVI
ncbi:hypothetical protein MIND_00302600 [Mycena indigotica]|uniref:F-box domain-containing protein n=1 Tax=Mycena indigotica TaxID=2126181 RepID=A0A8H6T1K8_9AGAR|nr:uncharacterized protein MIND_00302600 [Mycena indigotica]KAF7309323.1 hypothetical protein MIND_00302600 [Mycena indigotica]